jgi:hypothetical protein
MDPDDAGASERRFANPVAASIPAPVVDEDDLVGESGRLERALELGYDLGERFALFEDGEDGGDFGRCGREPRILGQPVDQEAAFRRWRPSWQ